MNLQYPIGRGMITGVNGLAVKDFVAKIFAVKIIPMKITMAKL